MKIKIKDEIGNVKEIECSPSDTLKSLYDLYKPYLVARKGRIVRPIIFNVGGDQYTENEMENEMNVTLDDLGLEDGNQITATFLYGGTYDDTVREYTSLFSNYSKYLETIKKMDIKINTLKECEIFKYKEK